jgi:maltoporin
LKKFSVLLAMFMVLIIAIPAMAGAKADGNQVTFTFKAPEATTVCVSGTFNGWSPSGEKMTKGEGGVWSVTIKLKPATYQYKFVVDGTWTPDLEATTLIDDGFSGKNAVLIVKAAGVADNARLDKMEQEIAALKESQGGFSFHGYARTGILVDKSDTQYTGSFYGSGAWYHYRLGNESDTFIENTLEKKWVLDDGSWALVHFLFCHQNTVNGSGWNPSSTADSLSISTNDNGDQVLQFSGNTDTGFFMRESYAELGNLPDLGHLSFWAGQRYYRRDDIHLLDFFWRDFTGAGAGVEGINIGDSKLAIAYMAHSGYAANNYTYTYTYNSTTGKYELTSTDKSNNCLNNSLIFSLTNLKVGPGSFDFDLAGSGEKSQDSSKDDGTGLLFTSKYSLGDFFGLTSGSSFVGLLYGSGIDSNGFTSPTVADSNKDGKMYRVVLSGVTQITDNFEIQPVLVYQDQKADSNSTSIWKSFGIRPMYHFNKNFALQGQFGFDTNNTDCSRIYTIAPTVTLDLGYYTRPQLRLTDTFVSQADGTSQTVYGISMETWW